MAIGTGLPIPALFGGLGNQNSNSLLDQARDRAGNSGVSRDNLGDNIDLSAESLASLNRTEEVLNTIRQGIQSLRQQEVELATAQLQQIREQIEFVSAALPQASGGQQDVILGQLADIAGGLGGVSNRISGLFSGSSRSTTAQLFSANFNAASARTNGGASVAEELNVEFSFLQVSSTEETIEISETEEGLSIERTVEQTNLVVAELSVEQTQTVTSQGGANFQSLVQEFRDTLRQFSDLINQIQEQFGIEKIPEPFMDLIKGLVTDHLEGTVTGPLVVNEEA